MNSCLGNLCLLHLAHEMFSLNNRGCFFVRNSILSGSAKHLGDFRTTMGV